MRRALPLGLALSLAACVSAPVRARYEALQHSAYPGNPTRDFTPYQARE